MKIVSRRYSRSSSFKMAVLFTILLGLSACLLGYYLYDFGKQNFLRETEAAIDNEMEHMLSHLQKMSSDAIVSYIDDYAQQSSHPLYVYMDAQNNVLAGSLQHLPQAVERVKEGVIAFTIILDERDVKLAAKIHTFNDGTRLLIARDIQDITASYERLQWITSLIMAFMLAVVLVSFFISIFVVKRINVIADTARQIMETDDLSKRISIEGNWDDLSNLAQILNTLLARVEGLMEGIRDVSDSIAHDLRTPLTRLRNRLEAAKDSDVSRDDIESFLAETDHMLHTFNALLRISNIEKAKRHQAFAEVDLRAVLQDITELYEPLADEKQVKLACDLQEVPKQLGDRDLLFQLCANVLDNAIKFSPENSTVSVEIRHKNGKLVMTIADQGIGVAEEDHEKVFERFYRADKSRHTQGNGLGLSLVKAIADQHEASITLHDNHPGLRVEISF